MSAASSLPTVELDNVGARRRRACYFVILALAAGLLTAAVCRVRPLLSANDRSRWCTVWSLVERGTYQIDEIDAISTWSTIDKVRHEGHFYSSKPPLLSTAVAGLYWAVKKVTPFDLNAHTAETVRILFWIVNVLPLLLATLVMVRLVERYAEGDFTRVLLVAALPLATFLTTFSVTLNNHSVAALAVLFAVYPTCRILLDGSTCPLHFACAGFFASLAAVNELPALSFAAAVIGLLFLQSRGRTLVAALPAAAIPLAASVITTYLATGGWRPFYSYYGTDKYRYVLDGVPSYWMNPAGLDANTEPPWTYLLHCTLGHHGIFSLSPVFLLALAAWLFPPSGDRRWRWGLRLVGAITAVVLGFYLTRTENYNYGGNSAGLRWMFWLIPLWLVSLIPVLDRWANNPASRIGVGLLLAITTFSSWYPIDNPWQAPWLYTVLERNGVINYSTPVEPFNRPLLSIFPLIPGEAGAEREWIEYSSTDVDGTPSTLRLADEGPGTRDGRAVRNVSATWNAGKARERRLTFSVDVTAFSAGEKPAASLVWSGDATAEQKSAVQAFLQGMPTARPYRRDRLRYLFTPLRHNAFECRQAASRVRSTTAPSGPAWHRCDLWLTSAVPFGLLQFEQTVYDEATGATLAARRYTATACSRSFENGSAPPQSGGELNIP